MRSEEDVLDPFQQPVVEYSLFEPGGSLPSRQLGFYTSQLTLLVAICPQNSPQRRLLFGIKQPHARRRPPQDAPFHTALLLTHLKGLSESPVNDVMKKVDAVLPGHLVARIEVQQNLWWNMIPIDENEAGCAAEMFFTDPPDVLRRR